MENSVAKSEGSKVTNGKKLRRVAFVLLSVAAATALLATVTTTVSLSTGGKHDDKMSKLATTKKPMECNATACRNGGTCSTGDTVTCMCTNGYTGEYCETYQNYCEPNLCQNGVACENAIESYTCDCVPGFQGINCETDVDECSSQPCENGGTCNDTLNGYTCDCVTGTYGDHCEINPDDCVHVTDCYGGMCIDGFDSYTCDCNTDVSNVVYQKLVSQSSTQIEREAVNAIDGILTLSDACTHTAEEYEPWWQIDLFEIHCIHNVIITNRHDCYREWLENAVVLVGYTAQRDDTVQCGDIVDAQRASQESVEFTCEMGTRGRYVTVMLQETTHFLSLCEVEVYAPARRRFELRNEALTWNQANVSCHDIGAHLAKIRSIEENNYLVQLIEQYDIRGAWWTGVNDIRTEGHYVYADGTPLVFTNWRQYPREPSDANHEDCAMAIKDLVRSL